MKKLLILLLVCSVLLLCACGTQEETGERITIITLNGTSATVKGGGAAVKDNVVTIKSAGTYSVTGELSDGQLIVNTGDDAMDVILVLDNASITSLSGPALHILQAKNVRLQLAEGSSNLLCSGVERELGQTDESISGGAIFAEDDLDIEGEGSLKILGYLNNGITCKDDLDLNSGSIEVVAVNNGIRASESLEIKGGSLQIRCGNDGLKTSSAAKQGKGYITIKDGDIRVTCGGDGVAAETELRVEGGSLTVKAEGDPALCSSKGLKSKTDLIVSGGTISVTSEDHALHSDAGVSISGCDLDLNILNGKGIDADGDISIDGGKLQIRAFGDAISTKGNVHVLAGDLEITSQNDGIEAGISGSGIGNIEISGGQLRISAAKKCLDARGSLELSGGSLIGLSGSEKQGTPNTVSNLGWLFCRLSGERGQQVTIAENEEWSIQAAYEYKNVFWAGTGLPEGEMVAVSNGVRSLEALVNTAASAG